MLENILVTFFKCYKKIKFAIFFRC